VIGFVIETLDKHKSPVPNRLKFGAPNYVLSRRSLRRDNHILIIRQGENTKVAVPLRNNSRKLSPGEVLPSCRPDLGMKAHISRAKNHFGDADEGRAAAFADLINVGINATQTKDQRQGKQP
jgi:hypothetical protein